MPDLAPFLSPLRVQLNQTLLDPNNPRFAELGEDEDVVPEARFAEIRIQQATLERMKNRRFDVAELRDTIKNLGFLPIDRIVVRRWHGANEEPHLYTVVEGNRRIAALKWLIDLHESGRQTLTATQVENFQNLEVLLLSDDVPAETARWIVPGLRHVSGIKPWGPFQQATTVNMLRESGMPPPETAQSLGLSTRAANQLWRAYWALKRMQESEEYGEHATAEKFSFFDELLKRPTLRAWFGWDDNQRLFTKTDRINEFYTWIVGSIDENGDTSEPKLTMAIQVRDLGTIVEDANAMAQFRAPNGTLDNALARFQTSHPADWRPTISTAESVLAAFSADALRNLAQQDIAIIVALGDRIRRVLEDRERLAAN